MQHLAIGFNLITTGALLVHAAIAGDILIRYLATLPAQRQMSDRELFVLLVALAAMVCAAWARSRMRAERRSPPSAWIGFSIVVSSLLLAVGGPRAMAAVPAAMTFALLAVAVLYRRWPAFAIVLSAGAAHIAVLAVWRVAHLAEVTALIVAVVAAAIPVLGASFASWRRQIALFDQAKWAAERIAHDNVRLQEAINRREILSRSHERLRVAREVHDTVGHTLTAVLFQIKAAESLARLKPDELPERFEKVEAMVRSAIQEVRREVSSLRDEAERIGSWRVRTRALCESFADSTGVRINLQIDDSVDAVGADVGESIFRVVQESLTNAYRHGRATVVDVAMGVHGRRLIVRVSDNGEGASKPEPGNGLTGIRERVQALGGRAVWQTLPHKGFDLGIEIPMEQAG